MQPLKNSHVYIWSAESVNPVEQMEADGGEREREREREKGDLRKIKSAYVSPSPLNKQPLNAVADRRVNQTTGNKMKGMI